MGFRSPLIGSPRQYARRGRQGLSEIIWCCACLETWRSSQKSVCSHHRDVVLEEDFGHGGNGRRCRHQSTVKLAKNQASEWASDCGLKRCVISTKNSKIFGSKKSQSRKSLKSRGFETAVAVAEQMRSVLRLPSHARTSDGGRCSCGPHVCVKKKTGTNVATCTPARSNACMGGGGGAAWSSPGHEHDREDRLARAWGVKDWARCTAPHSTWSLCWGCVGTRHGTQQRVVSLLGRGGGGGVGMECIAVRVLHGLGEKPPGVVWSPFSRPPPPLGGGALRAGGLSAPIQGGEGSTMQRTVDDTNTNGTELYPESGLGTSAMG